MWVIERKTLHRNACPRRIVSEQHIDEANGMGSNPIWGIYLLKIIQYSDSDSYSSHQ